MRVLRVLALPFFLFLAASSLLVGPAAATAPQQLGIHEAGAAPCGVIGVPICPPGTATLIGIAKTANPTALPAGGGSVTYTYQVPNVGGNPLSSVTVTDDKCAPVTLVSGDTNTNSILDAGETWTYTCTTTLSATTTNTATAQGFDVAGSGTAAQASATVTVANCPPTVPNCTPPPCHSATGAPTQCPSPTPCIPGTQPGAVPCPSSTPGTTPCPPTVPTCTPPPCQNAAGAPTQCPSPTPCVPSTQPGAVPCPSSTPNTSPCPPTVPNCTPPPCRTATGAPTHCPSPTPCTPGTLPGAVPCPSSTPNRSQCATTARTCSDPPSGTPRLVTPNISLPDTSTDLAGGEPVRRAALPAVVSLLLVITGIALLYSVRGSFRGRRNRR